MSKAPVFSDLLTIQLQARARSRWQDFNDIHTVMLAAASHAYVLLCAASGQRLNEALPVVEFAGEESMERAQSMTHADLGVAALSSMAVLCAMHTHLCEQEWRFSQYVEATNALLALKDGAPGAVTKARVLALHHRLQETVRRQGGVRPRRYRTKGRKGQQ